MTNTDVIKEAIEGLDIRTVNRNDVMPFFTEHHYLATPPTNTQSYLGIFYNNELIGTITYGYPTGPPAYKAIAKNNGVSILTPQNVFELTRLYIKDVGVKNMESSVISKANDIINKNFPNVKAIVTYADPSQGHVGTIYQATNAVYQGKGANTKQFKDTTSGRLLRGRDLKTKFGTSKSKEILAAGHPVEKVDVSGKMRYVYILKDKKTLEPLIRQQEKPYVKYDTQGQQNFPFKYKDMAKQQHVNEEALNEYGDTGSGMGQYSAGMSANSLGTYSSPNVSQNPGSFASNHPSMYYPVGANKVDMYNNYRVTAPSDEDVKKLKKTVTPDEIIMGMDYELKRMFMKNKSKAREMVVKNLKRDPKYYSSLHMMGIGGGDQQLSEDKKVIKENMNTKDLNVSVSEVQKIIDEMVAKRNPKWKDCDPNVADAYNDSIKRRNKKNGQETGWFKKLL